MSQIGNVLEPILVGSAFLIYLSYHLYLWWRVRRYPMTTTIGHNHEARNRWCILVMRERRDILAIQTTRNTLMSSSLLASTSLTLSAVVATYLVNTITIHGLAGLDLLASSYLKPVHKFLAIMISFWIAFYCYMQSVRASNHSSYLLGLSDTDYDFTPDYVFNVIRIGADFHTVGTRMFYLAFLFVIWIFGPIPFVSITLILVFHLWYLDRALEFPTEPCQPCQW